MNRYENWASAIWFIENVFYNIPDKDVKFVIVGNKPSAKLLKYVNDRIIVTGFIDDIKPYFTDSLCVVAPLILGAGVKIKIIESLSAGIPVLTNEIGIEGINAVDGEDFFFCSEPEDYLQVITKLLNHQCDIQVMTKKSKSFIKKNYNLDNSASIFIDILKKCEDNNYFHFYKDASPHHT